MNANIGGYIEALPASYAQHPTKKYPLLLYLHGKGGMGSGSLADLQLLVKNVVPGIISRKQFPANFTVNGKTFQFIVITPQFKGWPLSPDVNAALNYVIKKYRVDTNRIYISGNSMGGGGAWDYAIDYGKKVTAIVPIAGASWPTQDKADKIAAAKVAVWAFHNQDDPTVPSWYSTNYVQYINNCKPKIPARVTLFAGNEHNSWSAALDPNYRENGKNIYEWMLSYHR